MPPRRRNRNAAPDPNPQPLPAFDPNDPRFIDLEAHIHYYTAFEHRNLIYDRGFDDEDRSEDIDTIIAERQWPDFATHFNRAHVLSWVRELYVNAHQRQGDSFFVRQHWIHFTPENFAAVFNLPEIPEEHDYIFRFCHMVWEQQKEELDRIVPLIAENFRWKPNNGGRYLHFHSTSLTPEAKYVMHFVNAKLMPSKHGLHVIPERAAFIYAILFGEPFDVRRAVLHAMEKIIPAGVPKHDLAYPFLITRLCELAGVVQFGREDVPSMGPLLLSVQGRHIPRPAVIAPLHPPGSHASLGHDSIAAYEYIFARLDRQDAVLDRLTHIVEDFAAGVAIDVNNYPAPPVPPPRPQFLYPPPVPEAAGAAEMEEDAA